MTLLQWLGLALMIGFPAMFAWVMWEDRRLRRRLHDRGVTTVGTVVEVKRHITSGYGTSAWVSTIRFADSDGAKHECEKGVRALEGDEYLVTYDPQDPSQARAVGRPGVGLEPGVDPVQKLVAGALLLGIALIPGLLLVYFGSSVEP